MFYPLWAGIIPDEVLADGSGQKAFGMFSSVNMVMNKYNGTIPVTMVQTGQQWCVTICGYICVSGVNASVDIRDWPNTWPPHQYVILNALKALPKNLTSQSLPQPSGNQTTFDLIPSGQLGPISSASSLFSQTIEGGGTVSVGVDVNKGDQGLSVVNGGNSTGQGEGWADLLGRELSNRYVASALCNW